MLLLFTVKDPKRGQVSSRGMCIITYLVKADEKEHGEDGKKVEGSPDEVAKQPDPKIEIVDSIDVTLLPYVDSFLGQIKILFTIKPFIRYTNFIVAPMSYVHVIITFFFACRRNSHVLAYG